MDIAVREVSKFYAHGDGENRVLDDIDLTLQEGEFVSIVGTSGSGKTTLLNIIGGLDRDFEGEVTVGDNVLSELDEKQVAALRNSTFGFVFQQFNLLDHLTALENVHLPAFFTDADDRKGDRARTLLEKVGLADKMDVRPPQLSGGQKQRVAIARALYNQPDLILCDEPTGSLDRKTGMEIMKLFQDLNESDQMTLIIVTHEEHIARMASRIIRLEDGHIVADEPNEPIEPDELGLLRLGTEPGQQTENTAEASDSLQKEVS